MRIVTDGVVGAKQAKVFTPFMFIAHIPQTPCPQDFLNVKDVSRLFLIYVNKSITVGPMAR